MRPRSFSSRNAIDSCALQLRAWKPFQIQTLTLDPSKPHSKKPCRSDRSTAPGESAVLDFSKISLADEAAAARPRVHGDEAFRWFQRKRRRHGGSRSVSGRSSDRSGTRRRCCSVGGCNGGASGAYATCSDFPMVAGGTDSSGEMFMNGDGNWGSDASEVKVSRKDGKEAPGSGVCGGGSGGSERESLASGSYQGWSNGALELVPNESGYGSETGYKGDAEVGYEDELDEEEDDGRILFWGAHPGGNDPTRLSGKVAFSDLKTQPRCRRKKHDWW